jgi:dethiobiotin synthetase
MILEADKIGSATSPLKLAKTVSVINENNTPKAGDVVVVKALSESVTYGNLELPNGRLAKINRGDVLFGVLGKRRALKGFVGDVPDKIKTGDKLNLLNMGGVIGVCKGHHSSLSDAIEVEVLGIAVSEPSAVADGLTSVIETNVENDATSFRARSERSLQAGTLALPVLNIADNALKPTDKLHASAPIVIVAGTCMNSGKTVAATEIIKQAHHAGLKVAGAKMSGVAALRDTLNMQDSGAEWTASFLDCGLPSTVDYGDLSPVAKAILNHLNSFEPDLIVVELGDGIVGGYAVDSVLKDFEIKNAISSFVFCASDYVGVIGGIQVLKNLGLEIDVIAGSVTDSQMGEDFVQEQYKINAGNARRDGLRLFNLVESAKSAAMTIK